MNFLAAFLPAWAIWLGGLVILLVGCFAIYRAVASPSFLPNLVAYLGKAAWSVFGPILLKRKSPEEEAKDHQIVREGGKQKESGR